MLHETLQSGPYSKVKELLLPSNYQATRDSLRSFSCSVCQNQPPHQMSMKQVLFAQPQTKSSCTTRQGCWPGRPSRGCQPM